MRAAVVHEYGAPLRIEEVAKVAGATIVAVDVTDGKLQLAKELGASYTVNATTEDPVEAIQALGEADATRRSSPTSDGHTRVIRETRRLADVNDAFAEVLSGRARARLAFDMR